MFVFSGACEFSFVFFVVNVLLAYVLCLLGWAGWSFLVVGVSDGGARFGSWLEGSGGGVRLWGECFCSEFVWVWWEFSK